MIFFFSIPAIILSLANSKCLDLTLSELSLAANKAASLHKLDISAPLNPGVKVANLLAYSSTV